MLKGIFFRDLVKHFQVWFDSIEVNQGSVVSVLEKAVQKEASDFRVVKSNSFDEIQENVSAQEKENLNSNL